MLATVLFCASLLAATEPVPAGRVVLEEVVAVVGGSPILASDLELAALVGLLPREPDESAAAHHARLLQRLIDLEVQFRDLEGRAALHRLQPPDDDVLAELAAHAGGDDVLRARLDEAGFAGADLRRLTARLAAVRAHVEQRLRPRVHVGEPELRAAYAELVAELGEGVEIPPLAALEAQLTRLVTERQLNREIERWMEQARARVEVSRPEADPPPGTALRTPMPSPARGPRSRGSR